MNTILVTGAPGNVGTEVVRELQLLQADFRVGARDPGKAQAQFGADTAVVAFDFLKPETFAAAFAGINRLFLVRPPALSNVERDIAPAVRAAVAAGVSHIVFLSLQGVENNRVTPHYKIEQLILELDVDYTFLRAGFFMQNLSTTHRAEIRDQSVILVPAGQAQTSFIDARDIAAVAARTLTQPGHERQIYTLTGAEALTYHEVAALLTAALGRKITYTNPSILRFIGHQKSQGNAWGYVLVLTALYTITRFGNAKTVTPDVAQILGRPPISFAQFVQDFTAVWRG